MGYLRARFFAAAFFASIGLDEDELPRSEFVGGWVPRPRRKAARERRLALVPQFAKNVSIVTVAPTREAVRVADAMGRSYGHIEAVREVVRPVQGAGTAVASTGLRFDRVPVFNGDELMALAVWAANYR